MRGVEEERSEEGRASHGYVQGCVRMRLRQGERLLESRLQKPLEPQRVGAQLSWGERCDMCANPIEQYVHLQHVCRG